MNISDFNKKWKSHLDGLGPIVNDGDWVTNKTGWYVSVQEMSYVEISIIDQYLDKIRDICPEFKILQIKSKFHTPVIHLSYLSIDGKRILSEMYQELNKK